MADYTQTEVAVLAQQALTHPANVIGGAIDVSTYLGGIVYVWKGCTETTADLTAGLDYLAVEASGDADGNDWYRYFVMTPSGTAPVTEALSAATEPAGETVLAVADDAGFTPGMLCFLTDATDEAVNSEWVRVVSVVTDTSITIQDGLAFAKASGDDLYTEGECWAITMDFAGIKRIRVVVIHQGATGSNWVVKATLTAATDLE